MGLDEPVVDREAVRAVLLAPDRTVLLMQFREPSSGVALWLTPGGGKLPGEDAEACLRRELQEETGLQVFELGPLVWTRRNHECSWNGKWVHQREQFYLVHVPSFKPSQEQMREQDERAAFIGYRWWSAQEIEDSCELFVPRRLAGHFGELLREGPPAAVVDVGE